MTVPGKTEYANNYEDIERLIQVMQNDPVIQKEVLRLLKLDSYHRRILLNNWLEQLRKRNAPENLLSSLSVLFDNKIAAQFLAIIYNVEA